MNLAEPVRVYDKQVTDERTAAPWVDSFASFRASVRDGDVTIPKVAMNEPLKAECEHFLDCVLQGEVPLSDGATGVAVVRTLDAVMRSARAGGREERV
jgi:predicted dehydrogenase